MLEPRMQDPLLVSLSSFFYRLLLFFMPSGFRSEYAPHMAQVFRDACLSAYRRSGAQGLGMLWAFALFDWLKIMIEERFNRETDMNRSKFIRMSGWGLVLAAVALLTTFWTEIDLQTGLYRIFGAPTSVSSLDRIQNVTDAAAHSTFFVTILLITIGLIGLRTRYGKQAGDAARAALGIGVIGGAASLFYMGSVAAGLEIWIPLRNIFVAVMFAGMLGFGLAALRRNLMPRGNILPVLAGIWWPLLVIDAYVVPLGISRLGPSVPFWFTFTIFLLTSLPLALLGVSLQSDASPEPALV